MTFNGERLSFQEFANGILGNSGGSPQRETHATFYTSAVYGSPTIYEYSSPTRRYGLSGSYGPVYGGSPQRTFVNSGKMDEESVNQKICEILKVTEVISDHVASINGEGEADALVNLTQEDADELWRCINGGYGEMNLNNLIRFLQDNANYNINPADFESLNLVVGGKPHETRVSKDRFNRALSYVDSNFSNN